MNKSVVRKAPWRFPGMIWIVLAVAVGIAVAAIFHTGGSSATIERHGGADRSYSQVIRDKDGQTILTQDAGSTDITVQHRSGTSHDRDDRSWIDERFSRRGTARERLDNP